MKQGFISIPCKSAAVSAVTLDISGSGLLQLLSIPVYTFTPGTSVIIIFGSVVFVF